MKNNFFSFLVLLFILTLFIEDKVKAQDLQFNASEIQSLEKGNKIIAKNGVEINDPSGITIKADQAEYDKIKSVIVAKQNVKIIDKNSDNILITNEAIYLIKKNKIISKNETLINVENKYFIDTFDITYDRNSKEIFSKNKTIIKDNFKNVLNSSNFRLTINDKVIEAKNIKLIDYDLNEYSFEIAKINLKNDEIIGKDLSIKFNRKYFSQNNDPRLKANVVIIDKEKSKFKKGVFTICKKRDDKCPPWEILAEEINHDKSKKLINYKNAWLKVYDMPILYFPKFFHPDPTVKRQSGFLMPVLSSSRNLGNYISVPYFHVISDNKDLTFSPRFYDKEKTIYQTEYRQDNKNSEHIVDFSILNESRFILKGDKTKGSHFFSKSNFNTNLNFFENSKIDIAIQQVSKDTYLKTHKLKSPLIGSESLLNSKILFEGVNNDLNFDISAEVFEDLSKEDSDRYEYIFPNYNLTKYFENNLNGELSFTSSGNNKIYDTNVKNQNITNDLNFNSNKKIFEGGFVTSYEVLLKNFNSDSENTNNRKNQLEQNFQSIIKYHIEYPLKKEGAKFDSILKPILSARFSPNKSKNLRPEDRIIDYNNIFSLNRIGSNETVEGGQSITIGNEFKTFNKSDQQIFSFNLATVFRDEENLDLPEKSTLNRKTSNIVGEILLNPNNFIDLKYDFSLDNNLQTLNYNFIDATLSVNNFVTSFEFLEKNNIIGEESYFANQTSFNFNENNSLTLGMRQNKHLDINEYYNLIYEYRNDCLKAAIEYKKDYYEDRDLKPQEQIFFSLTIMPFGGASSPNLK